MTKSIFTYRNLLDFSNALDQHILSSDCFFDGKLLTLIEKYLGYHSCSFVIYESNSIYKGSCGHNLSMGEQYEQFYRPIDPLAKYITQHYQELISRERKVILSSEVFSDYLSSQYCQSLRLSANLAYAAVILFDNLRLTVYHTLKEDDFSEEEIAMLSLLEQLLSSRYTLFSKIVKPTYQHTLEELKNLYFDTLSTGVIILNSDYVLLDSNNIGRQYMTELSKSQTISSYFSKLIPLLNLSVIGGEAAPSERMLKLEQYLITIRLYVPQPGTSSEGYVYFITLTSNEDSADRDTESGTASAESRQERSRLFASQYHLSSREMEVVEALSRGEKYQDIADTLFLSINTVRTHIKNIYRKLGINNQRNLLYLYNQFIQNQ